MPRLLAGPRGGRVGLGGEKAAAVGHGLAGADLDRVEFQADNFPTVEEGNAWIRNSDFASNPIGVIFDPEDLLARFKAGEPLQTLVIRPPLPEGKSPFDMLRL